MENAKARDPGRGQRAGGGHATGTIGKRAVETFRMVPDRLWLDRGVRDIDLRVWCCLCFLARDRGHCFEGDAIIADKMEVSVKTVQRGLASLEARQYIHREKVGRERRIDLQPQGDDTPLPEFTLKLAGQI